MSNVLNGLAVCIAVVLITSLMVFALVELGMFCEVHLPKDVERCVIDSVQSRYKNGRK